MAKLIISRKQKPAVLALKAKVIKHQNEQDKDYLALCRKLKVQPEGLESEQLFDHIFNGTKWTVMYS